MPVRETLRRWLDAPATAADNTHQRNLVNSLLVGTATMSLLVLILSTAIGWQVASGRTLSASSLALLTRPVTAFAASCHSGILACVLFLLLLTVILVAAGTGPTGLAIPILLASILLRPWANLVIAGLGSLAGTVISVSWPGYVLPVPSLLTLFAAAPVVWLAIRNLKQALRNLREGDRRLVESEEHFRRMAESIRDGLTIVEQGQVTYVNARVCEITGRTREELAALSSLDLATPEEKERLQQAMEESYRTGTLPTSLEFWIVRPDGAQRCIHNRYIVKRGEDGLVDHCVVTTDVTERQRMAEHLRQAHKMEAMGRLAAGVAHDFSNYLTVMGSYAGLLLDEMRPDDMKREMVTQIQHAVEQSKALTRQILAFNRQQMFHPQVLCVNEVIARAEGILRRLAGRDVDLVIQCDPGTGLVRADPGLIEQVLLNLVTNARDAIPRAGTATIQSANVDVSQVDGGTTALGSYVMIAVSDTGTGIDAAVLPHIFEPFFTTKEDGLGTGLGLSTVYDIVRQSGGYVEVESEPGQGTTFRVYLPRVVGE